MVNGSVMNSQSYENDLTLTVEALQGQLRWTRRIGVVVAAVLAGLIVFLHFSGRTRVRAQEFSLTDANGRVRARLGSFPEGPGLAIYAASGEPRVQLVGGGEDATLNLHIPGTATLGAASVNFFRDDALMSSLRADPATATLEMHSAAQGEAALISLQGGSASLTLSGSGDKTPKVSLETDATHACASLGGGREPQAGGSFCLHSPGSPALELTDLEGNRAVLGTQQNVETNAANQQGTSAASLALQHRKSGKTLHLTPQ